VEGTETSAQKRQLIWIKNGRRFHFKSVFPYGQEQVKVFPTGTFQNTNDSKL